MMHRSPFVLPLLLIGLLLFSGCQRGNPPEPRPELLIYCGITMVNPIRELANRFEEKHNCRVIITQGGSEDLYQSLALSRKGDLYFPGSDAYRRKHFSKGLLGPFVELGYNQAGFMVRKGNPHQIQGSLDQLLRRDIMVEIGNPESCSIGRQTRKILTSAGLYEKVTHNATRFGADSRDMNNSLARGTADLIVNWRATAFFDDNQSELELIDLHPGIAPRIRLLLNQLTFSTQPELSRTFMLFAASRQGQEIFHRYGFRQQVTVPGTLQDGPE